MTIDGWLGLQWEDGGQPLIEPPRLSPVVADPSFLFPEETPDGRWALFAHSAWGVHRYSSYDGICWEDHGLVVWNAMRPFVRKLAPRRDSQPRYILLYEKYTPLALPLTVLPIKRPWRSVLAMQESSNLRSWTKPRTVLEPSLPWMRDKLLGQAVSNPCLVEVPADILPAAPPAKAEAWRLYFSASLSYIDDCGFNEPKFIGAATGPGPGGPFRSFPDPLLGPGIATGGEAVLVAGLRDKPGTRPESGSELGAGSMKVIRLDDGWLGLQNRIFRDGGCNSRQENSPDEGRSRSAIFVMRSQNGLAWKPARDHPLIAPDSGWKSSHVYACDCRFREADGRWYLYFNARDGWRISAGRERIGRVVSL